MTRFAMPPARPRATPWAAGRHEHERSSSVPSRSPRGWLTAAIFRTFSQFRLGGAGGARTHDRRIMRSTASCTMRPSCTDGTRYRTDSTRRAGIN
jgi:hypothetical protein